jgi:DNA-binding IclR family transcriptional regulator
VAGNSKDRGRSVISKISAILLTAAEGSGYTLTEIATRSELPLSTVHRLVGELAAWGLMERGEDGRYRAGPPLRPLPADDGGSVIATGLNLREWIAPVMEDLFRTTGAQVRAGCLDGHDVAYIEKVSGHVPVTQPSAAARLPAHATALGRTLIAFSPRGTVDSIITEGLRQYTRATITSPERLRCALRSIRATRVAICDRELDVDWAGVAAPVFGPGGGVLAAIELRVRDLARDVPALRAPLAVAARCLSRELATQRFPAGPAHPWTAGQHGLGPVPTMAELRSVDRSSRTGRAAEPA